MKERIKTWESNYETVAAAKAITWMNNLLSKAAEHIIKDGGFHLELDIDMKSPSSKWQYSIEPKEQSEQPIEELT